MLPTLNVATLDGGAQWGCLQSMCATEMHACACDSTCNMVILGGLSCAADAGSSAAQQTCLSKAFGTVGSDTAGSNLQTCLLSKLSGCNIAVPEGGADGGTEGGTTEGGGSEASTTEGGGSEGGTSEGGTDGGNG